MPKRIIIVRHGESTANANLGEKANIAFSDIPLSEVGQKQAQEFANTISTKPNLIVSSNFIRAIQTSEPLRNKYPDVPFEIDRDIFECSYLDPISCQGTTFEERKHRTDEFWTTSDPAYKESDNCESFSDIIKRAKSFLDRIRQSDADFVVVFSHYLFMKVVQLLLDHPNDDDAELKKKYPSYKNMKDIGNCDSIEIR